MSRAPKPLPLTTTQARQIWLRAQRLDERTPFGEGAQAVADATAHLGYVQIDTINVIERCHHHILFRPAFRPTAAPISARPRASTEACSNTGPMRCPTFHRTISASSCRRCASTGAKGTDGSPSVKPADTRKVMRLVRAGPLTIRDIEDDVLTEKEHLWQSRKPSKRALQLAFYTGTVTISERQGMLKTYELMTRHFGWDKLPKPASAKDITAYLLDRALRSQGVVSLDSVCHLDAPSKKAVARLIAARVRRGELVPVAIDGAKQEHWAAPAVLEAGGEGPSPDLVHILSPFDPLIIQRKRTNLIFGYNHLFEAYVPKAKRKLGYFALPVLVGDEIVAALDLKTDRQARKLLMQKWTWVGEGRKTAGRKELKRVIEEELDRFARFQLAE
jgi:uncharacterized protein YcaQ